MYVSNVPIEIKSCYLDLGQLNGRPCKCGYVVLHAERVYGVCKEKIPRLQHGIVAMVKWKTSPKI